MTLLTLLLWPVIACITLPGLLVYFGIHIVRRGVIFVDLALAQVATLGTCICLMLGHDVHDIHTLYWSAAFTLGGALIFAFTRPLKNPRLPQEAVIGVVYVVAAAAAVLFLSRSAEGNEELKKTLVGEVLTVSKEETLRTLALYVGIAVIHFLLRRQFLLLTFQPDSPEAARLSIRWWDFLFYALFGAVVTTFVQIGGVLLIFSYLIVPALCAALLARSVLSMLLTGWGVAILGSLGGLFASYQWDFPPGAAIVCVLGVLLMLVALVTRLAGRNEA